MTRSDVKCSARETVQLFQQETTDFISPDLCLSNRSDLNPVDHRIWGLMQDCVFIVQDTCP